MRDRQTCIGCGKKSPETETNYTLISAQFGWRLTRYKDDDGTIVIEWRCPSCWRDYKKAKGADAIPPSGVASEGRSTPEPSSSRQPTRPPMSSRPAASEAPPPPAPGKPTGRPPIPRPTPSHRPASSRPPSSRGASSRPPSSREKGR